MAPRCTLPCPADSTLSFTPSKKKKKKTFLKIWSALDPVRLVSDLHPIRSTPFPLLQLFDLLAPGGGGLCPHVPRLGLLCHPD